MEEAGQISGCEIIKDSDHEQSQIVEDERSKDPPLLGDGSDSVEEESRDCDSDDELCSNNKPKGEDRISTLPDDILLHILTFLPTLDAVTTGTLSPRWENIWTLLPNLDFICTRRHFDTNFSFATFVDQTLILHRRRKVKRFLLQFGYDDETDESFASRVNVWVSCATRRNVEQLSLCLSCSSNITEASCLYTLPFHIYTNSSITGLILSGCNVAPKRLIDWRHLKSLTIGKTKLGEDVVQKLLSGSPVLEFMKLHNFCGINRLDVSSASLRKLVITNYLDPFQGSISELEIIAPNIHSLEISGSMYMNQCRLINVESLVECCLNFNLIPDAGVENSDYEVERDLMRELLHSLRHVKKLTLGDWGIQTLSMMEAKGIPSPRSSRKYLILESCIQKSDLPGIASLLESSPNLETLTIDMNSSCSLLSYREFFAYYEFDGEKYWTSQERSFTCLLLHLKTIKILGFIAGHSRSRLMFPLVQFLLKSARKLEKMVIDGSKVDVDGSQKNPDPRDLYQVTQKLLSFSRCSQEAVVLFSE